jgi:ParB-like chromosome segregation protein Spo0J
LSKVEFDLLKQSIKEEGLHIPIVINKQGIVLDGHHRFQACKELGIPLKYQTKEFEDSLEEKQFVIEVNLRRRQLNEFQRVEMGYTKERLGTDYFIIVSRNLPKLDCKDCLYGEKEGILLS